MRRLTIPILMLAGLLATGRAVGAQGAVNLRFATFGQGTAWYVYGATVGEIVQNALPPGSTVDVLPYAGGVGNPKMIGRGQADIALSFSITDRWALEGREAYDRRIENIRGLVGGLDLYYMGVLVTKRLPIQSLADLKEKKLGVRLMTLQPGSLGEYGARQLLGAYGITYNDLRGWGGSVTHTGYDIMAESIRDGRADMIIVVVTVGHPTIAELMASGEVRFIALGDQAVRALTSAGYDRAVLLAKTFKGQDEPIQTVAYPTTLIGSASLPETVAYAITRAIVEHRDTLANAHAALKAFRPEDAWRPEKLGAPLHPGAERYYRERRWMP